MAVVIGASGGIGQALVSELAGEGGDFDRVHALSRTPPADSARVVAGSIDVTNEYSVARAAERIGMPIDLVVIATGILHERPSSLLAARKRILRGQRATNC